MGLPCVHYYPIGSLTKNVTEAVIVYADQRPTGHEVECQRKRVAMTVRQYPAEFWREPAVLGQGKHPMRIKLVGLGEEHGSEFCVAAMSRCLRSHLSSSRHLLVPEADKASVAERYVEAARTTSRNVAGDSGDSSDLGSLGTALTAMT